MLSGRYRHPENANPSRRRNFCSKMCHLNIHMYQHIHTSLCIRSQTFQIDLISQYITAKRHKIQLCRAKELFCLCLNCTAAHLLNYLVERLVKSPARQLDLMSFRAINTNRLLSCGVVTLSKNYFAMSALRSALPCRIMHAAHCSSLQAVLFSILFSCFCSFSNFFNYLLPLLALTLGHSLMAC